MNAENFSRYLKDRSLLHQLPYEELKTMALQYPYCQPLQLLLLRKSLQDNRSDWTTILGKVAAATSDRRLLYSEINEHLSAVQQEEVFQLSEEYLELNSLEEEALELSGLEPAEEIEASESALELDFSPGASAGIFDVDHSPAHQTDGDVEAPELELPASEPDDAAVPSIEEEEEAEMAPITEGVTVPTEEVAGEDSLFTGPAVEEEMKEPEYSHAILVATAVAGLSFSYKEADGGVSKHDAIPHKKPAPRPKSSFTSWVAQFQPPDIQTQLSDIMESKKIEDIRKRRKKKKGEGSSVDEIVLQSITENGDLVSETLAKVLAKQGQYSKAEEMYRRLMLVFPEKSDYFAQQISNLKSK